MKMPSIEELDVQDFLNSPTTKIKRRFSIPSPKKNEEFQLKGTRARVNSTSRKHDNIDSEQKKIEIKEKISKFREIIPVETIQNKIEEEKKVDVSLDQRISLQRVSIDIEFEKIENENFILKKISKFRKIILSLILYLISELFWKLSLKKCDDPKEYHQCEESSLLFTIITSLFYILILKILIFENFSKNLPKVKIIVVITTLSIFVFKYLFNLKENDYLDHGGVNYKLTLFFTLIFFLVYSYFRIGIKLFTKIFELSHEGQKARIVFKKNTSKFQKIKLWLWFFLTLTAIFRGSSELFFKHRKDFNSSILEGISVEKEDQFTCKWKNSNVVWLAPSLENIFKPFFYYNGNRCENYKNDLIIYKGVGGRKGIVGFSSTKNFSIEIKKDQRLTQLHVLKNMKKVLGFQDPEKEIFLDFAFNPPKVELNLKKIELKKEVNWEIDENKKLMPEGGVRSILMIEIDGISRAQLYSKLPLTTKYLREKSKQGYFVKEFFKYHYTQNSENLMKNQETDYLNSALKNNFMTAYVSNYCQLPQKRVNHHHQFIQLACDYNYSPYKKKFFGIDRGPFGMSRNCYFGLDSSKVGFEYAEKFLKMYKGENKMVEFKFIDAQERSSTAVHFLDSELKNFLEFLDDFQNENKSEKILTVLYSKKGSEYFRGISSKDNFYNPFLVFFGEEESLNKEFFMLNLKGNENNLISYFDLEIFLKGFVEGEVTSGGGNEFGKNCEDVGIDKKKCYCVI